MDSTSSSAPDISILVHRVIQIGHELEQALTELGRALRDLAIGDPRSPWHQIAAGAVQTTLLGVMAAGLRRHTVGVRRIADAAGIPDAYVSAACRSGEIPAERSDSGTWEIDAQDGRDWLAERDGS